MKWAVLAVAIILNAFANILIKAGMVGSKEEDMLLLLKNKCFSLPIITGILCFVLALAAYSYVLSKLNLSIAYPMMTGLGFFIVILSSWIIFKESISLIQVVGLILIVSGVCLVVK